MVKKIISALCLAALLFLVVGCSVNQINEVVQPETAAPQSSIDVFVVDVYHILSLTPVLGQATIRDSVLISAALPNGWGVDSALYYIDTSIYKFVRQWVVGDSALAPGFDLEHFVDSIRPNIVKAQAITDFDSALGATYTSTNRKFFSFLGLHPINLPPGTWTDTTLPDTTGQSGQDSIYDKMVGCLVWLSVKTGSDTGLYSLGYFVGFQPHNISAVNTENAFSDGHPLTITLAGLADVFGRNTLDVSGFRVAPNPLTLDAPLSYFMSLDMKPGPGTISLFDARGQCRAVSTVDLKTGWNRHPWPQVSGGQLSDGMYIVKFRVGNQEVTRHIIIAR